MNSTVIVALITSLGLLLAAIVGALFLVNRNRADALKLITESAEKVVGVSDRQFDRLDKELEEYRTRARGVWHAVEKMIDVFEPWVLRFRPHGDEDSVTATVYAAEYLAGRDAIHDAREHLR